MAFFAGIGKSAWRGEMLASSWQLMQQYLRAGVAQWRKWRLALKAGGNSASG